MRRISDREITRRLAKRAGPEPPPDLVDRIKAEIPDVLQVGGAEPRPEGVRGFPPRAPALRPLWLLAASLLVVIGAGFVAVRFLTPRSDLAREIALGGVVRINDIVVTVPERSTVEKSAAAETGGVSRQASTLVPSAAPKAAESTSAGRTLRAGKAPASGEAGEPGTRTEGAPASSSALARDRGAEGSLVVAVRDGEGRPLSGAMVQLAFADRPGVGRASGLTGNDGAATFCCLAPHAYRLCTQMRDFVPATRDGIGVSPGRQVAVEINMARAPSDGMEHQWLCAPPEPPRTP